MPLRDGSRQHLIIYVCDEVDFPATAGVYVFGREFGDNVEPIYIGKAGNLRRRVREHTKHNIRLMKGIESAKNGRRVVQVAEWFGKPGQQAARVLPLIESALIKYALAEGYELLNVHGTKTPVHELSMSGNRAATRLFRSFMKIER